MRAEEHSAIERGQHFMSVADWGDCHIDNGYANHNFTYDFHDSLAFAETVGSWLSRVGLGGEGIYFPVNFWVEDLRVNKLVIMRGIPGSGKSYTAKILAGFNQCIYSTDDFWGEYYNFNPAKLGEAHEWNQKRVKDAMDAGKRIVVVDNTNTVEREWRPYAMAAKHRGYVVEFGYPQSEWWMEIAPRIDDKTFTDEDVNVFYEKNTHGVPFEVIKKMMDRFTPSTEI